MFEMDKEAAAFGVTALENRFITDYLPAAKGDYVKVYLWGLYACAHPDAGDTPEAAAQALYLTVPEVEAALRYWERRGLVTRLSDDPPQFRFYSPMQRQQGGGAAFQPDTAYVMFAESVYAAFGEERKVTPGEIALAWEWVQDVGLTPEAVLMLLHHCMATGHAHFSFKKAEKLAVRMKEAGVTGPEDAERFLDHDQAVHDGTRRVLSRMGKRRLPSDDELEMYEKWIGEWGFDPDGILAACRETTSGDPSFKYLDGILSGLRSRGDGRTGDAVKRQLAQERGEKELAQEVFSRLGIFPAAPAAVRTYRELLTLQPHAVLLLAAEECRRSHRTLEDMQALLASWRSRGLTDENAVREYLARYREANLALREIFEACGHAGRPTEKDRQMYETWKQWGMNRELMLYAAEQSRAAEGSKTAYLGKVLEAWHQAGITDIAQARAERKPAAGRGKKTVSAQQYAQREYTEDELLAVSDDLIEEARKHRG